MILFPRGFEKARATDAAAALGVSLATLSRTGITLVRKGRVSKRRSVKDDRVVVLSLSRRTRSLHKSSSGSAK